MYFLRSVATLHQAIRDGHLEIVQRLVTNGANINAKDNRGNAPLHIATRNRHLEIVQCLVMNGADINAQDHYGYTPLYIAACNGYLEILQCLVMNGADINAKDHDGYTPLYIAALLYHEDISIWLEDLLTNNRKCIECHRWTLIGKLKNEVCFECQWPRIRLLWIAKKKNEGPFSYLPAEIVREIINNF